MTYFPIADLIETWSEGEPEGAMDEAILADLAVEVGRHPWWRARASLVGSILKRRKIRPPARLLDVGCGWGVTLESLERLGYEVAGLDVSPRALERLARPGRRLIQADLAQAMPDMSGAGFDALLALDVLEHLDDDRAALARLAALARPGGTLIVSVPALPGLYAEFDAIQGHRRRYVPETLAAAFDATGWALEHVFFWGAWMVPLLARRRGRTLARPGEEAAATYRRYLRLPPPPGPSLLRLLFALERPLALARLLPTGTSLFALAHRAD